MARYIVKVATSAQEEPLALLIPFAPTSTLAEFTTEVIRRVNHNSTSVVPENGSFTIRFQSVIGPILDAHDQLADILRDGEELYFQLHEQSDVSYLITKSQYSTDIGELKVHD